SKINETGSPGVTRRGFIKNAAILGASFPYIVPSKVLGNKVGMVAPSDKINLGIIGCGVLGKANLQACLSSKESVLTAACDVWDERLHAVVSKHRDTCKGYSEYRELLNH